MAQWSLHVAIQQHFLGVACVANIEQNSKAQLGLMLCSPYNNIIVYNTICE